MVERIGNVVGVFEDVDSRNGFLFWGANLRIRVRIDLSRPLRRGIRIYPDGPLSGLWVPFRYERLLEICSICGIIGHVTRDCIQSSRSEGGSGSIPQYGDCLRFSRKGMVLNHFTAREIGRESVRESPRSH